MTTPQAQFSIIIPVLDEAEIVNQAVQRLVRKFPEDHFGIIVVDGDE